MSLTHGYVLYVVDMHTKGVIYSKQHYFKLFFDIFRPQSSLLSVLQNQACTKKRESLETYLHLIFDPGTSV